MSNVTVTKIKSVQPLADGRVRVTFEHGVSIDVDDDGSFIEWTGESEQ